MSGADAVTQGSSSPGAESGSPPAALDAMQVRFECRGEWALQWPLWPGISGRLRAGVVLGLRRLPDPTLPDRIAKRTLERLDATR